MDSITILLPRRIALVLAPFGSRPFPVAVLS